MNVFGLWFRLCGPQKTQPWFHWRNNNETALCRFPAKQQGRPFRIYFLENVHYFLHWAKGQVIKYYWILFFHLGQPVHEYWDGIFTFVRCQYRDEIFHGLIKHLHLTNIGLAAALYFATGPTSLSNHDRLDHDPLTLSSLHHVWETFSSKTLNTQIRNLFHSWRKI